MVSLRSLNGMPKSSGCSFIFFRKKFKIGQGVCLCLSETGKSICVTAIILLLVYSEKHAFINLNNTWIVFHMIFFFYQARAVVQGV